MTNDKTSLHPHRLTCAARRHRGAILLIVGVIAALCGYLAVIHGQRRDDARRPSARQLQQEREATSYQQAAHATFEAFKDSQR